MTKKPFRLTPYQVQFLIVVGFATVGYALYLRYLAIELSQTALACDAGLLTVIDTDSGDPLHLGRRTTTITPQQRRAVHTRFRT
ncbi:MAG: hypothetical protein JHD07_37150, partial [Bradyrhizobium sp.]|nr:hypothetical protein [Bradyrhizobium sp.]